MIPPTLDITHTGQELTLDGVRMVFQVTPGTEAPAEMNFYFPDHHALCMAENTTHTLHNIFTIRVPWSATRTPGRTTSPRTVQVAGDPADLGLLVSLLAPVDPDFAIVTA